MLFEFPMRVLGFRPCISMGETKQVKVRVPFTFSNLPEQHFFQMIKRLIRIVTDIDCVRMYQRTCLGKLLGHWHI